MKRFSVKDFVDYCHRCFICGGVSTIDFVSMDINHISGNKFAHNALKSEIHKDYIEIEARIRYADYLNFKIYYKTNKFEINNVTGLTNYLTKYKILISSICSDCPVAITSTPINFNHQTMRVDALEVNREVYNFIKNNKNYTLYSDHTSKSSKLTISDPLSSPPPPNKVRSNEAVKLPFIPRYKFSDKEAMIDKIKLYLIFS